MPFLRAALIRKKNDIRGVKIYIFYYPFEFINDDLGQLYIPFSEVQEYYSEMSNKDKGAVYEYLVGDLYKKAGFSVYLNGLNKGSHDEGRFFNIKL